MRSICSASYHINLLSNFLSKRFWKFTFFTHTWKFNQNDTAWFSTIKKDLKFTTEYLPTSHLGMVLQKATVIQIHCIHVLQTCGYLLAGRSSNITVLVGGKLWRSNCMFKQPHFSSVVAVFWNLRVLLLKLPPINLKKGKWPTLESPPTSK